MRKLGLVVCMLVVSMLVALGGSAEAAEYGKCVKVAKVNKTYKGDYADKNCQTAVAETGKYEWESGRIQQPGFTTVWKKITLTVPVLELTVKCKEANGSGQITGATSGQLSLTFTGCSSPSTGGKCTTTGHPQGVIATPTLATSLNEQAPSVVYTVLNPAWTPYAAEFICNSVPVRFRGSLAGVTSKLNGMSDKFTQAFEGEPQTGGQLLLTEDSLTEGLTWRPGPGSLYPNGAPTSLIATAKESTAEKWEIKAL